MVPSVQIPNSPFRVMVYTNDHAPAHVHIAAGNGTLIIDLAMLEITKEYGTVKASDRRKALALVSAHLPLCWKAWKDIHG